MVTYGRARRRIGGRIAHGVRSHPGPVCPLWDARPGADGGRPAAVRWLSGGPVTADATLRQAPEFELECLYDDPSSPSELTIFSPETPEMATEWLTVDRSSALRLDRMR
jgi:hypothetical protein